MESKVVDGYLLTPVDKALAISLVSKGFNFCCLADNDNLIEWFDSFVYDNETDTEHEITDEEIMKNIASSSKQIYMMQLIPIDFVEIKKESYICMTKYGIGTTVYVNAVKKDGGIIGSIRKGVVIGVDIREGRFVDEHLDINKRYCGELLHNYNKESLKKYVIYKVAFLGDTAKNGIVSMGIFTEDELSSDLDEVINKLKSEIK